MLTMSTTAAPVKIDPKQERELTSTVHQAVEYANALKITSPEKFEEACEYLKEVKKRKTGVEGFFKPLVDAAHAAHKALTSRRSEFTDPLDNAERTLKSKIAVYTQEQEKKRKDEEDRKLAAARDREEKERKELEEKAEKARAAGKTELADQLQQKAETHTVVVPTVESKTPEVKGVGTKTVWYAEVIDKSKVPDEYKIVDVACLNRIAAAMKGQNPPPGVVFKSRTEVVASRR